MCVFIPGAVKRHNKLRGLICVCAADLSDTLRAKFCTVCCVSAHEIWFHCVFLAFLLCSLFLLVEKAEVADRPASQSGAWCSPAPVVGTARGSPFFCFAVAFRVVTRTALTPAAAAGGVVLAAVVAAGKYSLSSSR